MEKREDTPRRLSRRKYETHRKKENSCFSTLLNQKDYAEICNFLKENRLTKVDLIFAGYTYLKMQQEKN